MRIGVVGDAGMGAIVGCGSIGTVGFMVASVPGAAIGCGIGVIAGSFFGGINGIVDHC